MESPFYRYSYRYSKTHNRQQWKGLQRDFLSLLNLVAKKMTSEYQASVFLPIHLPIGIMKLRPPVFAVAQSHHARNRPFQTPVLLRVQTSAFPAQ